MKRIPHLNSQLYAVVAIVMIAARLPFTATAQVRDTQAFRDSLYMEVQRHGRIAVGYLSYFKNSSSVHDALPENNIELTQLDDFFHLTLNDSLVAFDRVEIVGSASIEGTWEVNEQLSEKRAHALRDFLDLRYDLSARVPIEIRWIPEDWDGLEACVRKATLEELPLRDEILRIIRTHDVFDGREMALMRLDKGTPYRYMERHYFPLQRRAVITLIYDVKRLFEQRLGQPLDAVEVERAVATTLLPEEEAGAFLADTASTAGVSVDLAALLPPRLAADGDTTGVQPPQPSIKEVLEHTLTKLSKVEEEVAVILESSPNVVKREPVKAVKEAKPKVTKIKQPRIRVEKSFRPYVTLTTNLTAWLGVTGDFDLRGMQPNISVEGHLTRRLSVAASALYNDFDISLLTDNAPYDLWHTTAYTVEPRYRFLVTPRAGEAYAGIYGRMGDYNFLSTTDAARNHTGEYWDTGISLGYTYPVVRHFVIEAGVSAGYRHYTDRHFSVQAGGNFLEGTTNGNSFGLHEVFLRIGYRFGRTTIKR
ncbi:MAG: DUF3575 domain-containing protein [Prevotellaceae bacterium]|jgi:hypothetical protein|nr:DUF3575 domain-containing protein [Prevotellaceae bacterium]